MKMTLEQAKRLYGLICDDLVYDPAQYTKAEWLKIKEIFCWFKDGGSDQDGGKIVEWCGWWTSRYMATAMARRIRQTWAKMEKERETGVMDEK